MATGVIPMYPAPAVSLCKMLIHVLAALMLGAMVATLVGVRFDLSRLAILLIGGAVAALAYRQERGRLELVMIGNVAGLTGIGFLVGLQQQIMADQANRGEFVMIFSSLAGLGVGCGVAAWYAWLDRRYPIR